MAKKSAPRKQHMGGGSPGGNVGPLPPGAIAVALTALLFSAGAMADDEVGADGIVKVKAREINADELFHPGQWPPDWPYDYWDPDLSAQLQLEMHTKVTNTQDPRNRNELWARWIGYIAQRISRNYTGYSVERAPKAIREELYKFYHDNMGTINEKSEDFARNRASAINGVDVTPTFIELVNKRQIAALLKPLHEKWCNCKLKFTAAYGMRVYHNGNVLDSHVDRVDTHVISSIFHVADDTLEPWPVTVRDMNGDLVTVEQRPGDLLHYESAKIWHGRPTKLKGRFYANIFFHFVPVDWEYTSAIINSCIPKDWSRQPTMAEVEAMAAKVREYREKRDSRWHDHRYDRKIPEAGSQQPVISEAPAIDAVPSDAGSVPEVAALPHSVPQVAALPQSKVTSATVESVEGQLVEGGSEMATINSATQEMHVFMGGMVSATAVLVLAMFARLFRRGAPPKAGQRRGGR